MKLKSEIPYINRMFSQISNLTVRELEYIFHKICNDIRYQKQTEGICMDSNGNKVGEWRLQND